MNKQLKTGEYVRYGQNGICKVEGSKKMDFANSNNLTEYYILKPIADSRSTLYVPKENEALMAKIVPVLSKDEIDSVILASGENSVRWINDRNARNNYFQEILKNSDQRELIMMINCIYLKRKELKETNKKLSTTDESVLTRAEKLIQSDFAFVLGLPEQQVAGYIKRKLGIE